MPGTRLGNCALKSTWAFWIEIMGVGPGESENATNVLQLALHVCSNRMWSLTKHDAPSEAFAGAAAQDPGVADAACALMREHHHNMLMLEEVRHSSGAAASLCDDMSPNLSDLRRTTYCVSCSVGIDIDELLSLACTV